MSVSKWPGRRTTVALANAFEGMAAEASVESRHVVRGSRLALCLLLGLLALPFSAVPRTVGELPMNLSLTIAFAGIAVCAYFVWPLLGVRSSGWRPILAFVAAAACASAACLFLLRASAFDGLPAGTGGDAGNHVLLLHRFVTTEPDAYQGMVSLYAVGHWVKAAGLADDVGVFRVAWQLAVVVSVALAAGAALVAARPAAPSALVARILLPVVALLSLGVPAFFVALPLIHYYQGDGFLAQVFSLIPLALGAAAYSFPSIRLLRCLALFVTLVAARFTYVLNAADFAAAAAVMLFLELRSAPTTRRSVRVLLALGSAGLLGVALLIYLRLSSLLTLEGGFWKAEMRPQLLGLGALSLLFFGLAPLARRAGRPCPDGIVRLTRFLGIICILPFLIVSAWLLTGHPLTYYVQKFAFSAIVVGSLCSLPIALGTALNLFAGGTGVLAKLLGVLFVAIAGAGVFGLGVSAGKYADGFRERFADPPYHHLEPHAERAVWRNIDATLAREGARFGGFLTPRWPEGQFTNAHFDAPDYANVHQGGVVDRPGYCVFWYENKKLPASLQRLWSDQALDKVNALQVSPLRSCKSFTPRSAPETRLSLCSRCFHGQTRSIPIEKLHDGFHGLERSPEGQDLRWTNGNGRIPLGLTLAETALVCSVDVRAASPFPYELLVDGQPLGAGPRQLLPLLAPDAAHTLEIRSAIFVPAKGGNSGDTRELGVLVSNVVLECTDEERRSGGIKVTTATYGRVCGAEVGNRTDPVADACDGRSRCSFQVSNEHGDPTPGCAKDFRVEYRCGLRKAVHRAEHPAEQGESYTVELSCE